jgi:tryptophan synthase beta chain
MGRSPKPASALGSTPGVGPEQCVLKDIGRAEYVGIHHFEALGLFISVPHEGIIAALGQSA